LPKETTRGFDAVFVSLVYFVCKTDNT